MSPNRFLRVLALVALAVALPACDPCFGVSGCGDPRVDVYGEVMLHLNQRGMGGVEVIFVRTGGLDIDPDSQVVRTDSAGRFRLRAGAAEDGVVRGTLGFRPPAPYTEFAYVVPEVRIGTLRAEGDQRFLGSWGVGPVPVAPHLHHVGEVLYRGTGEPVVGARVEFRPTGGVGLPGGPLSVPTGTDGRFYLRADAGGAGAVVGDLSIAPPAPWSAITARDLSLQTAQVKGGPAYIYTWRVGGQVSYQGELVWADTYTKAPGIEVEFRRLGGIAVEPESFVVRTGTDGRFTINPKVREAGEVVAELRVRAPRGEFVIGPLRLATVEDDNPRFLAVYTVLRP